MMWPFSFPSLVSSPWSWVFSMYYHWKEQRVLLSPWTRTISRLPPLPEDNPYWSSKWTHKTNWALDWMSFTLHSKSLLWSDIWFLQGDRSTHIEYFINGSRCIDEVQSRFRPSNGKERRWCIVSVGTEERLFFLHRNSQSFFSIMYLNENNEHSQSHRTHCSFLHFRCWFPRPFLPFPTVQTNFSSL